MKPCPFCGSGDVGVVEFVDGEGDRLIAVGCSMCGSHGASHIPLMDDARPAAIASWERRAPAVEWRPISCAPQDGTRLMLWDSVSKRPVFGSWRGDNPKITHYAAEPAGPEVG
ncbi:hypothetical protein B9Y60_14590 [Stenotrophomonas maltophilia]|uniref:Lar family restriction alleviation protein n=1 Tax=Stenotrophomonas maltophilia TaxID=40324 RepID=UPI000C25826A|nr:Lar family restriction alleviation protein [Stenotrophomonas maltophilia]PJL51012.1 hypothetical protein B9Y73_14590 [Stenotrophomonas maltophilia]PJL54588.1 hypothetical protein B9Y60_14590 [Stenotrophomonas maltophilia]